MRIKNKDNNFVILSMSRFDHLSSASLAIAKELSKQNIVYYVDFPLTIKDLFLFWKDRKLSLRLKKIIFGRRVQNIQKNLKVIIPWPVMPINWLKKGKIYNVLSNINDTIFYYSLRRVFRKDKIDQFILLNSFNPFYGSKLAKSRSSIFSIYQCRDNLAAAKFVFKHGPYLEEEKAKEADMVVVTSRELEVKLKKYNPHTFFLPNAVDFDLFNQATTFPHSRPSELENISGKIIGYIGEIGDRFDLNLMRYLIRNRPDYCFICIGPANINLDDLKKSDNFIHIGFTKYAELPNYLHFFDVSIIPFICNEFTKYIYPLKINEYLAAGKPVVSTNFSIDINEFDDLVFIKEKDEDFLSAIVSSLESDSETEKLKRINYAKKNSWEHRMVDFFDRIEDLNCKIK